MIKLDKVRYQEKLVELTDFQKIKGVINDKRLQTFLDTPFGELLKQGNELGHTYEHAFPGWPEPFKKRTFGDMLSFFNVLERGRIKFYISEDDDIEGLIFYTTSGNIRRFDSELYVKDICVISFNLEKNSTTLVRDLYNLVKELREKYREIHWVADKNNPAVRTYKSICERYNGGWGNSEEQEGLIEFFIPGTHPDPFTTSPEPLREKKIILHNFTNDITSESVANYYYKHYIEWQEFL